MQNASMTGGQVVWVFDADTGKFDKALIQAEGDVERFTAKTKRSSSEASSSLSNIGKVGLVGIAGAAIAAGVAITKNLGGAVRRFDTLNNFTSIMGNLGYGADEAQAAIDRLDKGVQGLPTSLDQIASAMQDIAPSTADLNSAVSLTLALNNALVAGGKPMQQQAAALNQWTNALATGKADMNAWASLASAMPGQMKQISNSLGYENWQGLAAAVSAGTLSINDVNNAMVKLNNEGLGDFPSFAEQAKNASGGLETGMANMNTAITRGIAGIFKAIGGGEIDNAFKTIGSSFEGAMKRIADGITFIKQNWNIFGPLIATGVTLIGGFIGIATAITVASKALIFFRAMLTLITRHPIIGILTLIAGAAVGIATAIGIMNSGIDEGVEPADDLNSALGNIQPTLDGASGAAGNLSKQLAKISEQEDKVRKDYNEQLAELVNNTRKSIRGLVEQLDEEEKAYKATYEKRLVSFEQAQAKEEESHYRKVKELENQINFLRKYDNETNRKKLSELQFALAKENSLYSKQGLLRKQEYDLEVEEQKTAYEKKRDETQARLAEEQGLLDRHREAVASIRNVILLDEIQKLQRSRDEQLKSLNQQKTDAITKGGEAGAGWGSQFATKLGEELNKLDLNAGGKKSGETWSSGFSNAIKKFFTQDLPVFWEGVKRTFSDLGAVGKEFWGNFRLGLGNIFARRAAGGPVNAGQPYLVGENPNGTINKTTEMFVPNTSGRIVNAKNLQSMMGTSDSGTITNVYNVTVSANGFIENKQQQRNLAELVVKNIKEIDKSKGIT